MVPFFDIAYEEIFPELEDQQGSKLEKVNEKIAVIKELFGFHDIKRVTDIDN